MGRPRRRQVRAARARPGASACAGACGGRSTRRAAPEPSREAFGGTHAAGWTRRGAHRPERLRLRCGIPEDPLRPRRLRAARPRRLRRWALLHLFDRERRTRRSLRGVPRRHLRRVPREVPDAARVHDRRARRAPHRRCRQLHGVGVRRVAAAGSPARLGHQRIDSDRTPLRAEPREPPRQRARALASRRHFPRACRTASSSSPR